MCWRRWYRRWQCVGGGGVCVDLCVGGNKGGNTDDQGHGTFGDQGHGHEGGLNQGRPGAGGAMDHHHGGGGKNMNEDYGGDGRIGHDQEH